MNQRNLDTMAVRILEGMEPLTDYFIQQNLEADRAARLAEYIGEKDDHEEFYTSAGTINELMYYELYQQLGAQFK